MEDDSQPSLPSFTARNQRFRINQPPPAHLFTDSSEPAAFSSDDDPSLETYAQHGRRKKRRIGSWFHQSAQHLPSSDPPSLDPAEAVTPRAKAPGANASRQLKRDLDSGVWLASDDIVDNNKPVPDQIPGETTPLAPRTVSGFRRWASFRNVSPEEAVAQRIIQECIDEGCENVDISSLGLESIASSTIQPLSGFHLIPTVVQDVPFEDREIRLKLYMANNRLSRIPASICDLSFLTVLSLRGNGLRELPPCIAQLRNLEQLNLAQNALRWLPSELLDLITSSDKLESLSLHPNPFCQPESRKAAPTMPSVTAVFASGEVARLAGSELAYEPWGDGVGDYSTWLTMHKAKNCRGGCLIARSPVQYYDGLGEAVNTDMVNLHGGSEWIPTADLYSEPAGAPAARSGGLPATRARALLELALQSCSQATASSKTDLQALMPDQSPAHLLSLLDRVDQLHEAGPQRCTRPECAGRRPIVLPRTEWLDWWVLGTYDAYEASNENEGHDTHPEGRFRRPVFVLKEKTAVPFISRGCSWRCVPEIPEKKMPTPECKKLVVFHANTRVR